MEVGREHLARRRRECVMRIEGGNPFVVFVKQFVGNEGVKDVKGMKI